MLNYNLFSLGSNAFGVLKASYTSTRAEITELVEDAEFDGLHSLDQIQRAQQSLLTPLERLKQELGWLPELSPTQINDILDLLDGRKSNINKVIEFLPELAKANILAHLCGIARNGNNEVSNFINYWDDDDIWDDADKKYMLKSINMQRETTDFLQNTGISKLIQTWDDVDEDYLLKFINTHRKIAGFPQVEQNQINIAIKDLRKSHAKNAARVIWILENPGKIMTTLIKEKISNNSSRLVLSNFIQEYDKLSESHLVKIGQAIDHSINLASIEDEDLTSIITEISKLLKQWNNINQPVQIFEQHQGYEEQRSRKICENLRTLSIELANERGEFKYARLISEKLLHTFPKLESFAEMVRYDIKTLTNLEEDQQQSDALNPLIVSCDSAKMQLAKLTTINNWEYVQTQIKIIKEVFNTFKTTIKELKDRDKAFLIVRDLAIFINNDQRDPETAFRLIDNLIRYHQAKASKDLSNQLDEERNSLHRNWKMRELERKSNNFNAVIKIIDEMSEYSKGKNLDDLMQLKTQVERKQADKNSGWGWVIAIVVFIFILIIGVN